MTQVADPDVKLIVYKKIVEGDLSKFRATSNITPSGGGARDLRFSPEKEFFPVFKRMFTQNYGGILKGQFSWKNHPPTNVEIHPPTTSRPNEVRIAKVHECFPQDVIPSDSSDCVLLIVLDNLGRVCPYFTSQKSLTYNDWHPALKKPLLHGLRAHRNANVTPMGYIDIENGRNYTNERA